MYLKGGGEGEIGKVLGGRTVDFLSVKKEKVPPELSFGRKRRGKERKEKAMLLVATRGGKRRKRKKTEGALKEQAWISAIPLS